MDLSIVIPAYNEEFRLGGTLREIRGFLELNQSRWPEREVLVVDDGSSDGTAALVESLRPEMPYLRLISYQLNHGKGYAVRQGVLASTGALVVFTDADGSTPAAEIAAAADAIEKEHLDVFVGSRRVAGANIGVDQGWLRHSLGNLFYLAVRILLGLPFRDTQCGFKAFRGEVARGLFSRSRCEGFAFDVEILYLGMRDGLRMREAGVAWRNDPRSKVRPLRDGLRMLAMVLGLRAESSIEYCKVRPLATIATLIAAAGLLYAVGLGAYPLTDRDEGLYATVIRNMLETGDYMVPMVDGKYFFHKPPALYWAATASSSVFGLNEVGLRLPSVLFGIGVLILLAYFVRRAGGDRRLPLLAVLSLAFTPMFVICAKTLLTDMPLAFFTTASILCFFVGNEIAGKGDRRWYLASWLCLAASAMVKGPVGPAVILPTAGLYCLARGNLLVTMRRSMIPVGALIFLLVNYWYYAMIRNIGWDFVDEIFLGHVVKRGLTQMVGHNGGPLYYVPVLLLGGFPFAFAAIAGAWTTATDWRRSLETPGGRLALLSLAAVGVTLLAFGVAATKLPHYILPAMPFVAILSGTFLCRFIDDGAAAASRAGYWLSRVFAWPTLGIYPVAILLVAAAPLVLPRVWGAIAKLIRPDSSEYALPPEFPSMGYFPLALALAMTLFFTALLWHWRRGNRRSFIASLAGACVALALFGIVGGDMALAVIQDPAKEMAMDMRERVPSEAMVASYGLWKPSLFFYGPGGGMHRFQHKYADDFVVISDYNQMKEPLFVVSRVSLRGKLETIPCYRELAVYDSYLLFGNGAAAQIWHSGKKL